jgi:hypothetical protein
MPAAGITQKRTFLTRTVLTPQTGRCNSTLLLNFKTLSRAQSSLRTKHSRQHLWEASCTQQLLACIPRKQHAADLALLPGST